MCFSMDIFLDSDSSFYEYISLHRKKRLEIQKTEEETNESYREQEYEDYYYENVNKRGTIFQLKGLNMITFTHKKIKFSFAPKAIVDHISENVLFYCSIRYTYRWWMVMRNSLPVNVRPFIYTIFFDNTVIELNHVIHTVQFIYDILVKWCEKHNRFMQNKYERYLQNPNEVFLDSEDEELFLTEEEAQRRRKRKQEILRRMIPPALKEIDLNTRYKRH